MDAHEVHTPHVGHTGHRWLDILLGGAALTVSCISLYVAVHHGDTMEKLVAASSWPYLQFSADIVDGSKQDASGSVKLRLMVENGGVGPARLETLEVFSNDAPVPNVTALGNLLRAAGKQESLDVGLEGTRAVGQVIGAKSILTVVGITAPRGEAWGRPFTQVASALRARLCYCSVFDECYVVDNRVDRGRATKTRSCPVVPVPYQDDVGTALVPGGAAANR